MHAKHPPTYADTPGKGEVKAGVCVFVCVSDAQSESCVIDCASGTSVCTASLLQLTYVVFDINN